MLDGTVFRSPIIVDGVKSYIPTWTKPITIARHAYGDIYKNTEISVPQGAKCEVVCTLGDGRQKHELIYDFEDSAGIVQGIHNKDKSIKKMIKAAIIFLMN